MVGERWRRVGFLVDAALGLPARGVLWGPPLRFLTPKREALWVLGSCVPVLSQGDVWGGAMEGGR
jgi:hypothetical protein